MNPVMMIFLSDGLQTASGTLSQAPYSLLIYCRVPADWIDGLDSEAPDSSELWLKGPTLSAERMETLFQELYGANWRLGNSDGSQYVVLGTAARMLNPRMPSERPWLMDDPSSADMRFFHYVATADGNLKPVAAAEL